MKTINRREAIKKIGTVAFAVSFPINILRAKQITEFDIVIQNGSVLTSDGMKNVFLGIKNRILTLSDTFLLGKRTIDATGKIVSPGFIDILADNKVNPYGTYKIFEKYKVTDGCTSVLQLHGGHENPKQFYSYFSNKQHYVNYGVAVFSMRLLNSFGSKSLMKKVEEGLDAGAIGVSYSIEYNPVPNTLLLQLARTAKKYDRPFFLHLRDSSKEKEIDGVVEAIEIAKASGVKLHIDHLNSTGGTFDMPKALKLIRAANDSGTRITCCVYPYSYWATNLASERFGGNWQKRYNITYEDLRIVGQNKTITKENFNHYRNTLVIVAVPEGTMPLESTFDIAIKENFCFVASDGGIEKETFANNHPRGAGCFATAIRRMLDIGISIDDAIKKVTLHQKELLSPLLINRGEIKNGANADITIFDHRAINGRADIANPNQFSEGIDTVIVNGEIVYEKKLLQKTPGIGIKF